MAIATVNPTTGNDRDDHRAPQPRGGRAAHRRGGRGAGTLLRQTSFAQRARVDAGRGGHPRRPGGGPRRAHHRRDGQADRAVGRRGAQVVRRRCASTPTTRRSSSRTPRSTTRPTVGASRAWTRYEPLGVVLAVMPWNYPLWQVIRFAAPALMAGNTGLLKHASNVPQSALFLDTLFERGGFPQGSFRALLIGGGEVGAVIADPRVKAVTLTGLRAGGPFGRGDRRRSREEGRPRARRIGSVHRAPLG